MFATGREYGLRGCRHVAPGVALGASARAITYGVAAARPRRVLHLSWFRAEPHGLMRRVLLRGPFLRLRDRFRQRSARQVAALERDRGVIHRAAIAADVSEHGLRGRDDQGARGGGPGSRPLLGGGPVVVAEADRAGMPAGRRALRPGDVMLRAHRLALSPGRAQAPVSDGHHASWLASRVYDSVLRPRGRTQLPAARRCARTGRPGGIMEGWPTSCLTSPASRSFPVRAMTGRDSRAAPTRTGFPGCPLMARSAGAATAAATPTPRGYPCAITARSRPRSSPRTRPPGASRFPPR